MARTPGPGEDEESELRADKDFRILMVSTILNVTFAVTLPTGCDDPIHHWVVGWC